MSALKEIFHKRIVGKGFVADGIMTGGEQLAEAGDSHTPLPFSVVPPALQAGYENLSPSDKLVLNRIWNKMMREKSLHEAQDSHGHEHRGKGEGGGQFVAKLASAKKPHVTETPAFKQWFGDSKIVDASGKPLVTYHGQHRDFDSFDVTHGRGNPDQILGVHFAKDPSIADAFAGEEYRGTTEGGHVKPCYLSIKKPLVIEQTRNDNGSLQSDQDAIAEHCAGTVMADDKPLFVEWATKARAIKPDQAGDLYDRLKRGEAIGKDDYNGVCAYSPEGPTAQRIKGKFPKESGNIPGYMANYDSMMQMLGPQKQHEAVLKYKKMLQAQGFDGIQYQNTAPMETQHSKDNTCWIIFENNQAKSASGNKGTFNPKSNKITESEDAAGHEHKGSGPGGGQFTSKGTGGAGATAARQPTSAEIRALGFDTHKAVTALDKMHDAVKASKVSAEHQKIYHDAIDAVCRTFTPEAAKRFQRHMNEAHFYESLPEVTNAIIGELPGDLAQKFKTRRPDATFGGAYTHVPGKEARGKLFLDGGEDTGQEFDDKPEYKYHNKLGHCKSVYSHEFGHVIDGPDLEISRSKEWQAAWKKEIVEGKSLSQYAESKSQEGFAEFHRLLFQDKKAAAEKFPMCYAVWKKWGLV